MADEKPTNGTTNAPAAAVVESVPSSKPEPSAAKEPTPLPTPPAVPPPASKLVEELAAKVRVLAEKTDSLEADNKRLRAEIKAQAEKPRIFKPGLGGILKRAP